MKKGFAHISKCYFDIQTIFYCCEVAFLKSIKRNSVCQLESLVLNIIKELVSPNNIPMKKYITNFKFKLSTEETIIYVILSFYDLDDISNTKFIKQFEKEIEEYSINDAKNRLNYLINSNCVQTQLMFRK